MLNNALTVFNFEDNEVRTVKSGAEAWFVAADVASVLGYSRTRDAVARYCKGPKPASEVTAVFHGGATISDKAMMINEPDLYRLMFGSTLPNAERFRDWVFEVVLPQIRRTGRYTPEEIELSNTAQPWHPSLPAPVADAVEALRDICKLSRHAKLTAVRKLLAEGTFLEDMISADLREDLRYFSVKDLASKFHYVSAGELAEDLFIYGYLDDLGGPTPKGRLYARMISSGDLLWRIECVYEIREAQGLDPKTFSRAKSRSL